MLNGREELFWLQAKETSKLASTDLKVKMEMINLSEGQMHRQINEAQGKVEEILTISKATAESIEKIGHVLSSPGGEDAFNLKLKEKYLQSMQHLADGEVEL